MEALSLFSRERGCVWRHLLERNHPCSRLCQCPGTDLLRPPHHQAGGFAESFGLLHGICKLILKESNSDVQPEETGMLSASVCLCQCAPMADTLYCIGWGVEKLAHLVAMHSNQWKVPWHILFIFQMNEIPWLYGWSFESLSFRVQNAENLQRTEQVNHKLLYDLVTLIPNKAVNSTIFCFIECIYLELVCSSIWSPILHF